MTRRTSHSKPPEVPTVPIEQFGKDHWAMLAYVQTRIVDKQGELSNSKAPMIGELDKRHMRCNPNRHPLHNVNSNWSGHGGPQAGDPYPYGSVTATGVVPEHDDWDVLNDLEAAGLVEVMSEANAFVRITDKGVAFAQAVAVKKMAGSNYSDVRFENLGVEK